MERSLGVHEMSVRLFLFPCPVNHLCSKGCTPMFLNIDVKKGGGSDKTMLVGTAGSIL